MRVQPKWFVGVLVLIAYMVIVSILWKVFAVDYSTVQDSQESLIKGVVIPVGIGAVLLAILTTWFGWWKPVMREHPVVAPKWTLIVPVIMGLIVLVNMAMVDYSKVTLTYIAVLALGVGLVGFSEEILSRGLVIVGLRGSVSEGWVWFFSALLFGLLHGINALFGQSLGVTAFQIVMAFLAGSVFYVVRMSTGLLVVGMVLHAMWDFSSLGVSATGATSSLIGVVLNYVNIVIALVAVFVIVRAKNRANAEVAQPVPASV